MLIRECDSARSGNRDTMKGNGIIMNVGSNKEKAFGQNANEDNTLKVWEANPSGAAMKEMMNVLYRVSGNERYQDSAKYYEELYCNRGNKNLDFADFMIRGEQADYDELCMSMPFFIFYETQYNKKEKYNEIVKQFRSLREDYYDKTNCLYSLKKDEEGNISNSVKVLFALSEMLMNTSEEIYENYRSLIDLYRETLKGIVSFTGRNSEGAVKAIESEMDESDEVMLRTSVKDAIQMGIILSEKYETLLKNSEERSQEEL